MARGKIFTNRKQKVAVGEEKVKKSNQPQKKEKKSKGATKEDGHPVGGGDYFDPKTGVVFSTRPQDSCIPLMEANITKFYKEQGQLDNPEDHVTVALHVIDYLAGDSKRPSLVSTIPPVTATDSFNTEEDNPQIMTSNDAPITFWQEVKDPKTSHAYYWNPSTNAVSWTLPSNGVLTSEAAERSNEIQDPEREEGASKVTSVAAVSNGGGGEGEFHSVQSKGGKTSKKEEVTKKSKSSDNQRKQESQMLLVSSLSDEITRKLSYLHVDTSKLSELQLLDIKLKTRLEDWKEGALSSQYVLDKLKEIDGKILDIVQKGVSSDWNCLWDRGTCRFFYKHKRTEDVSWEFPTSSDCDDSEDKKDEEMERDEQEEKLENEEETSPTTDLQPQLQNNEMVKEAEEQQLDMEIESVSDEELPQLEDVEATTGNNNNNGNDIQEESTLKEVVTQPSVSLYGDDLPPPYNQDDEEEIPPTVDQMVLTELEAANQEALLRARLLEKMKNNTGDKTDGGGEGEQVATVDWKPLPVTSSLYQEEEKEEEKEVTRQDRSPSKEKEPEEVAPGPVATETSKEKRSISPSQDSRDSKHKRVKSESSSKRRSHQYHSDSDYSDERHSRTRRRSRERHTSSSYRSRRSRRYSDDSDGGSRRHGRSHRSRSKGRSRKKKDHRRRHRHGDSSSDEDKGRKRRHRRGNSESSSDDERGKRRHQSSSSEGEKERKETTPPVVSPPINKLSQEGTTGVPPPLEKSFVPAKFKPKKAGDEDKNESTLSQTQVEMIHNIASATGYPLVYTMDPQQYGQVTTYGQVAASYANPYGYTSVGGVAYDNYTTTYSTTPTTVEQPTVEPVAMATAESVSTVTTEPVVTSSNGGGSATEGNETKKEEETVIEAAATEKPISEAVIEPSQDTQNTIPATTDTPPADGVEQDTTQENESKQEESVKAEESKTVEPVRDVTPPLQDPVPTTSQIGYTISAPSTSYPASTYQQGYATGDQSGAYAAAAAYASYPYYTAAAYDPTQYAAAMNYYAAYQAAAYGAYYQQAGGTQGNGSAMQQPPTTKS